MGKLTLMRGVAAFCFRGVPGAMLIAGNVDAAKGHRVSRNRQGCLDRGCLRLPGKLVLSGQSHRDCATSPAERVLAVMVTLSMVALPLGLLMTG
jgi:hypothetical protein